MSTIPVIQTIKAPQKKEMHAAQGLLRHLTGAFNEGGLDKFNAELHSLCGALACSAPVRAEAIDGWLAQRARESLDASIAARAEQSGSGPRDTATAMMSSLVCSTVSVARHPQRWGEW